MEALSQAISVCKLGGRDHMAMLHAARQQIKSMRRNERKRAFSAAAEIQQDEHKVTTIQEDFVATVSHQYLLISTIYNINKEHVIYILKFT